MNLHTNGLPEPVQALDQLFILIYTCCCNDEENGDGDGQNAGQVIIPFARDEFICLAEIKDNNNNGNQNGSQDDSELQLPVLI